MPPQFADCANYVNYIPFRSSFYLNLFWVLTVFPALWKPLIFLVVLHNLIAKFGSYGVMTIIFLLRLSLTNFFMCGQTILLLCFQFISQVFMRSAPGQADGFCGLIYFKYHQLLRLAHRLLGEILMPYLPLMSIKVHLHRTWVLSLIFLLLFPKLALQNCQPLVVISHGRVFVDGGECLKSQIAFSSILNACLLFLLLLLNY